MRRDPSHRGQRRRVLVEPHAGAREAAPARAAGERRPRRRGVMDIELIKMLSPLGVGGLLASVIFHFYRQDFLRERNNHQAERERLLLALERNAAAYERLSVTIENLGVLITDRGRER